MNPQNKNKRTIIIIFASALLPFMVAWYLATNAVWNGNQSNHGELIIPPITSNISEFIGVDDFSQKNLGEIKGRWVLITVIGGTECHSLCQQATHKTQRLRLMLGKELSRIRRLLIVHSQMDAKAARMWRQQDPRLLMATPTPSLVQKLNTISQTGGGKDALLLMDPLGNLMLQYKLDFDPYKVKSDLEKLLRISQIG